MKNNSNRELLADERFTIGLGCASCQDRDICGGLNTPSLFDCMQLCCGDSRTCDYVCPKNLESFIEFSQSIKGFEFDNIPRSAMLEYQKLPLYIPVIFNSSNRIKALEAEIVGLQLSRLIDYNKGELKFQEREEVADYFGFSPEAKIVISGVVEDVPLENYWYARKRGNFLRDLGKLNPLLVTTPNFSSFSNSPRWDNMYNLKRIGICWNEFVSEGIPASLHMNGRTAHDWKRWADFINLRSEVKSISFEFATVLPVRKPWYVERLVELAERVDRRLQLVVRGGLPYVKELSKSYDELVFLDTDAFIKSTKRELIQSDNKSISVHSPHCYIIDDFLKLNIETRSKLLRRKIAA